MRICLLVCGFAVLALLSTKSSAVSIIKSREQTSSLPSPSGSHSFPNADLERLYLTETLDRTYYATIGIGTPSQYLRLLFHTGIADIWVRECSFPYKLDCIVHRAYHPEHSTTASKEIDYQRFETQFYPGLFLTGSMTMDDMQIGDKHLANQSFATFDEVYFASSDPHPLSQLDGFFGVGHPDGSVLGKSQFILNMRRQKLIGTQLVSIYLRRHGDGELVLGGVDPRQHMFQHKWVRATNANGAWNLPLEDVYMFSVMHACDDWCQATLTTGTSHIAGPQVEIAEINNYLFSFTKNGPSNRDQPCINRVRSIVEEFFEQKAQSKTNAQMCMSIGLCEESHIVNMPPMPFHRLLEHNVSDFQHNFGCVACLRIANAVQGMHKVEDYDPDLGVALCNWLNELDLDAVEAQDTEEVDCASIKSFRLLRFRMSNTYFHIDSPYYIYKRVHRNLVMTCHTEFVPYYNSDGTNWILGTSFLRAFHTVIDFEDRRIGFATPAMEI